MTLPYSFSRLKCKQALDMYLPKLVERKLHESGGIAVNLVTGTLDAHETAEIRDCSIQGGLTVGAGSKVVGCRIEPGAQLTVGDNCTVVDVYVREPVTIGSGSTVCSCNFNCSVQMGCDARVFWLTATYATRSPGIRMRFGDRLQAVHSSLWPMSVRPGGVPNTATAPNRSETRIGDDATLLCSGLTVSGHASFSEITAGNGLVVSCPWGLDAVDCAAERILSAPATAATDLPPSQPYSVTLVGAGPVTIGDDVRLEIPLHLSVKTSAKLGDHSKIQTVTHDSSRCNPDLYLDKLYMEPYSSLLLYGSTSPGATGRVTMQLGRGSTLCWLDTPKLSGMLRITAPAGVCTMM